MNELRNRCLEHIEKHKLTPKKIAILTRSTEQEVDEFLQQHEWNMSATISLAEKLGVK